MDQPVPKGDDAAEVSELLRSDLVYSGELDNGFPNDHELSLDSRPEQSVR